jgi:hypothetical protein
MILGQWASDGFLVYIRSQVLEWTNTMSKDMSKLDFFLMVGSWPFQICTIHRHQIRQGTLTLELPPMSAILIPKFHWHL